MRTRRKSIGALLLVVSLSTPFFAVSVGQAQSGEDYVPRLGDIMGAVQARHVKLWYAGNAGNWNLAAYELRQLKAGLVEAARFYAGIPVSNVTTMAAPVQSVEDAIGARDLKRFSQAFGGLTQACNGCHDSMARAFIVIQTPTAQQPFGDQLFSPERKPSSK
jgi:hypothetical protein